MLYEATNPGSFSVQFILVTPKNGAFITKSLEK